MPKRYEHAFKMIRNINHYIDASNTHSKIYPMSYMFSIGGYSKGNHYFFITSVKNKMDSPYSLR